MLTFGSNALNATYPQKVSRALDARENLKKGCFTSPTQLLRGNRMDSNWFPLVIGY